MVRVFSETLTLARVVYYATLKTFKILLIFGFYIVVNGYWLKIRKKTVREREQIKIQLLWKQHKKVFSKFLNS